MQQFDVVTATFKPKRSDDLREHARTMIGKTMQWMAGWEIEDGPYSAQYAMIPQRVSSELVGGWVPECDLEILEKQE